MVTVGIYRIDRLLLWTIYHQLHPLNRVLNMHLNGLQLRTSLERVVTVHCLAALDLGSGVDQPFDCHRRRFVLRHTHRPQRRPCPICTSRSGNVLKGRLSRTHTVLGRVVSEGSVPVSEMKVRSLVGLSHHSTFHWRSTQSAECVLLCSDEMMSCCASGTNG